MEEEVRNLIERHSHSKDLTEEEIRPGMDWSGAFLEDWNLAGLELSDSTHPANFEDVCLFNAKLQKSILVKANFSNCNLEKANLSNSDLRESEFDDKTEIEDANLYQSRIENSTFKNIPFDKKKEGIIQEKNKEYHKAKEVYIELKNYYKKEGRENIAGRYFYKQKLMETQIFRINWRRNNYLIYYILYQIFRALVGYGERPLRLLMSWISTISIYSLFYFFLKGIMKNNLLCYKPTLFESFYFSGVTFATLGYGDLTPKPNFYFIAVSESIIGAIFMALFIFVFARKLMR